MTNRAVSIADLKNNPSAHLARVRAGEEVLVRDRRTPIAASMLGQHELCAAAALVLCREKPRGRGFVVLP